MFDIAYINAFTIYKLNYPNSTLQTKSTPRIFLTNLSLNLVKPYSQPRSMEGLHQEISFSLRDITGPNQLSTQSSLEGPVDAKRRPYSLFYKSSKTPKKTNVIQVKQACSHRCRDDYTKHSHTSILCDNYVSGSD